VTRTARQRLKYVIVDLLTANVAVLIFDIVRYHMLGAENVGYATLSSFLLSHVIMLEQLLIPLLLSGLSAISGYYNRPLLKSRLQEFIGTAFTAGLQTVVVYFALLTNQQTSVRATNYELLLYLFLILWACTYAGRIAVTLYAFYRYRTGHWRYGVLVVGSPEQARAMADNVSRHSHLTGYTLASVIELDDAHPLDTADIADLCRDLDVQEILFPTTGMTEHEILRVLYPLIPVGLPVKVSSESLSVLTSNIRLQNIYEEPYVDITSPNVSDATLNVKRMLDILVSLCVLIVLALPMLVIALIVRSTSPGGAFFCQERIGRRQKPFNIYKFRSMRIDAEASGPQLSSATDRRVTPVGAWMRKYRIDELPQFWNVLRGDMSLVGPRPERRHYIRLIMERAPYYSLVHQVRPGITSWGMVKYGYASGVDQMVERLRYDLVYLANISITNDLKIIIYTVKTVLKGRGV